MNNMPITRVAAIHDISGFSKCSLTVIIPILSAMKIQVCPIPTAVLSNQTSGFNDYEFIDTTDRLDSYISKWKNLNIHFDCIYTGFLGSQKQVNIISQFINDFSSNKPLIVIDPVLGDEGALYSSMDKHMISEMKNLIKYADIITPNSTEAKLITGITEPINNININMFLYELSKFGCKNVIITGIPDAKSQSIGYTAVYEKHSNHIWQIPYTIEPVNYPGCGDIFASVLVGAILNGMTLYDASKKAVDFLSYTIKYSKQFNYPVCEGVLLESCLNYLI